MLRPTYQCNNLIQYSINLHSKLFVKKDINHIVFKANNFELNEPIQLKYKTDWNNYYMRPQTRYHYQSSDSSKDIIIILNENNDIADCVVDCMEISYDLEKFKRVEYKLINYQVGDSPYTLTDVELIIN